MMEGAWIHKNGGEVFEEFDSLVSELYSKDSLRHHLGFDPVETYLDSRWVYLENNLPVGRFALYSNPHLKHQGKTAVALGSYECIQNDRIAKILMTKAKKLAKEMNASWIIGPMEGSTWSNYRFDLKSDTPKFFMEPTHHVYYSEQWLKEGFEILSTYVTKLDDTLEVDEDKIKKFESYFIEKGAVIRHLNRDDMDADMKKIGSFSLEAFSENFLFTPISVDDFVAKYSKIQSFFDPELVWIVEDAEKEIHALLFAIPDHWDAQKETMIIKSIAGKKDSPFRGISTYLSYKIVQTAKENGYHKVLHAFMLKENSSINISKKYNSQDYKEYGLYAYEL